MKSEDVCRRQSRGKGWMSRNSPKHANPGHRLIHINVELIEAAVAVFSFVLRRSSRWIYVECEAGLVGKDTDGRGRKNFGDEIKRAFVIEREERSRRRWSIERTESVSFANDISWNIRDRRLSISFFFGKKTRNVGRYLLKTESEYPNVYNFLVVRVF